MCTSVYSPFMTFGCTLQSLCPSKIKCNCYIWPNGGTAQPLQLVRLKAGWSHIMITHLAFIFLSLFVNSLALCLSYFPNFWNDLVFIFSMALKSCPEFSVAIKNWIWQSVYSLCLCIQMDLFHRQNIVDVLSNDKPKSTRD